MTTGDKKNRDIPLPRVQPWNLLPEQRTGEPRIDGMKRVILKRKGRPLSVWSRWFVIGSLAVAVQTQYGLTVDGDLEVRNTSHFASQQKSKVPVEQSVTVFLTTTGAHTYTIPNDWSDTNTIAALGGGGNGGALRSTVARATGGGAGAFSSTTITGLSPGNSISYSVGAASADSWFQSTSILLAKGGSVGKTATSGTLTGGTGGQASAGVGTTKHSGGDGGDIVANVTAATGGGGAAGDTADGSSGTSTTTTNASTAGGNGGSSGGTGGNLAGANGNNGTNFDSTHGSGGGGAGNISGSGNISGGDGGLYGAGGGGCANTNSFNGSAAAGAGSQGLIWIIYTAVVAQPFSRGFVFG